MNNKKQIIIIVCTILCTLVSITLTTYAWLEANYKATIQPLQFKTELEELSISYDLEQWSHTLAGSGGVATTLVPVSGRFNGNELQFINARIMNGKMYTSDVTNTSGKYFYKFDLYVKNNFDTTKELYFNSPNSKFEDDKRTDMDTSFCLGITNYGNVPINEAASLQNKQAIESDIYQNRALTLEVLSEISTTGLQIDEYNFPLEGTEEIRSKTLKTDKISKTYQMQPRSISKFTGYVYVEGQSGYYEEELAGTDLIVTFTLELGVNA